MFLQEFVRVSECMYLVLVAIIEFVRVPECTCLVLVAII